PYEGSDCSQTGQCGDDKVKLDAGAGGGRGDTGTASDDDGGSSVTDGGPGTPDSGIELPPTVFLDLNGNWSTHYAVDLSNYLFGISDIADELDLVDQALNGYLDTGFPPLDAFILSIIQQYVPSWVVNLVDVLNTAATLFDVVEANGGRLTITQDAPRDPRA